MDATTHPEMIVHERLKLTRDPDRGRYELRQDDAFIGFLGYCQDEIAASDDAEGEARTVVRLQHTIINEAYGRQGYARALVALVLQRLSAEGYQIVPECTYVQSFLQRYPRYESLVYQG
ncbi:MAG: GNAT family N-acetyltransferase [Micrococcus sp.]|nr:GNAT family N-acetyltransferase [Micrococcus sp.]